MTTRTQLVRTGAWPQRLSAALFVMFVVVGLLAQPRASEARLDPFYIVTGQSFGTVTPRVLFVLDTSGSMGFEQPWPDQKCTWDGCESDGPGESRVHAARKVINEVVAHAGDSADFAMMSFGMARPPQSSEDLPYECYSWDSNKWYRFTWVAYANQPWGNVWKPLTNIFGGQGTWILCGDNRPFPYLRHDDLGGFSLPNNSNEALSDEPLYKTKADYNKFKSSANYSRDVQFFPRFIGRRANLDCDDEKQRAIVTQSWGDWGNTNNTKISNICGRDFYYWPYVDGNPGYSYYSGYSLNDMWHVECEDDGACFSTNSQTHRLGVNRRYYSDGATLYVPFYSKAVLNSNEVAAADKGPLDPQDAAVMFDGLTSENHLGGIDVSGGTPWRVAIGNVDWQVKQTQNGLEAKPATPKSNAAFSHTTVASYLAFLTTVASEDVCRPTMAILVTDGQPDPWASQGGTELYSRLAKLRKVLGAKVYLVGFGQGSWNNPLAWERMHHMACAAAGANSTLAPCNGSNDFDWDTCRDPEDPGDGCAWLADDSAELAEALATIIDGVIETEVPAGAPTVATEFQAADLNDPDSDTTAVQTTIEAWTQTPAWRGHVTRGACTDKDPDNPVELADYCKDAALLAIETDESESFGPCPLGRVWDAGECLAQTEWSDRRLYTHDFDNNLVRIADGGEPTDAFVDLVLTLNAKGKIKPALTQGNQEQEIAAMVNLLLGRNGPGGWKLPGLPRSAPLLIRRVARYNSQFLPSVGIRDPHCAGRRNVAGDNVPASLQAFSTEAWSLDSGGGFGEHYDYAEAVLVGDDTGLVHGFHYDSGNELFGFLPLALINNSRVLSLGKPSQFGQPEGLAEHVYGVASSVNAGWAWDEDAQIWRHLAVFGLGPGGSELVTLDVSHMGRLQDDEPVEVVWTSSTSALATEYAQTLGETWSRPALVYAVPNDAMSLEPKAYLVFGSGYRNGLGDAKRGRVAWMVDAITGQSVTAKALMHAPAPGTTYDTLDDVTAVSNIAVTSHCLSRYWGEMQEAYWADAAGRLYRWDLGADLSDPKTFPHLADSGGTWPIDQQGFAQASPAAVFPACQGKGEFSCTVKPIAPGTSKGDVFSFGPAVAANNRIDDIDNPGGVLANGDRDQFLIALISGSPNDKAIDPGAEEADFHSSVYMLVDDHRTTPAAGLDIPGGGALTQPGAHPRFMRLPLNKIERTRHVEYADGTIEDQTRPFSKRARPIRAPLIYVNGVANGTEQVDASLYYVSFMIYEPGDSLCDPRWYDDDTGEWSFDSGATYEVTYRLGVGGDEEFDFMNGYVLPSDPGDGFGTSGTLGTPVVRQLSSCPDGNCGPILEAPSSSPCDPNQDAPMVGGAISIQTGYSELQGFTPLEIPL
ncbi:type IV pilin biogenesis protein [Enhygromyxa salina]|uniref:Type IV fimbrial biogenesis protein PilY1 n=1 Tax=Enhygromyxa salina TaxID=215803 RepID=A0A2S9YY15_9BACT|nr:type IV pilin biogenesis protein [Enhygromyxa salina]PRQ09949.1 hypothetical protein ENSA7_03060 [Enhygromyxa salina]